MDKKKLIEKIRKAGFTLTKVAENAKTSRQNLDDGLSRKSKLSLAYIKKGLEVAIDKGQKIVAEIDADLKRSK